MGLVVRLLGILVLLSPLCLVFGQIDVPAMDELVINSSGFSLLEDAYLTEYEWLIKQKHIERRIQSRCRDVGEVQDITCTNCKVWRCQLEEVDLCKPNITLAVNSTAGNTTMPTTETRSLATMTTASAHIVARDDGHIFAAPDNVPLPDVAMSPRAPTSPWAERHARSTMLDLSVLAANASANCTGPGCNVTIPVVEEVEVICHVNRTVCHPFTCADSVNHTVPLNVTGAVAHSDGNAYGCRALCEDTINTCEKINTEFGGAGYCEQSNVVHEQCFQTDWDESELFFDPYKSFLERRCDCTIDIDMVQDCTTEWVREVNVGSAYTCDSCELRTCNMSRPCVEPECTLTYRNRSFVQDYACNITIDANTTQLSTCQRTAYEDRYYCQYCLDCELNINPIKAVRLTNATQHRRGALYTPLHIFVGEGFETTFQFVMHEHSQRCWYQHFVNECDVVGGDGIALIIHNSDVFLGTQNTTYTPQVLVEGVDGDGAATQKWVPANHTLWRLENTDGGLLGYEGIPNSIAIEFDIFQNANLGDPRMGHISVHSGGPDGINYAHEEFSIGVQEHVYRLADEDYHNVRVRYKPDLYIGSDERTWGLLKNSLPYLTDGSGVLEVFVDDFEEPVLTTPLHLPHTINLIDPGLAWMGFAATTGTRFSTIDVWNWCIREGDPSTMGASELCQDFFAVNSNAIHPPRVKRFSTPTANEIYTVGDTITIIATISRPMFVQNKPALVLNTYPSDARAVYVSGGTTDTLTFEYTVKQGENSKHLEAASIDFSSGTIFDVRDNPLLAEMPTEGATGSLSSVSHIEIDTSPPEVVSVTSSMQNGAYKEGASIFVEVEFTEVVVVLGGTNPLKLKLDVGTGTPKLLPFFLGANTNKFLFTYEVGAGENTDDLDYVDKDSLLLQAGQLTVDIRDRQGYPLIPTLPEPGAPGSLSYNKDIRIDNVSPIVLYVESDDDGFYNENKAVRFVIKLTEAVNIDTNTPPSVEMSTGDVTGIATYESGAGTQFLTFKYTVGPGEESPDLDVNGELAVINPESIEDEAQNEAQMLLPIWPNKFSLAKRADIVIDTKDPIITEFTTTKGDGELLKEYREGVEIPITVHVDEVVFVSGYPRLSLGVEQPVVNVTYVAEAIYQSGSGTQELVFVYTVQDLHNAVNIDVLNGRALSLAGGSIRDQSTNPLNETNPLPNTDASLARFNLVVDTVLPEVIRVYSGTPSGAYAEDVGISMLVEFSERVVVTEGALPSMLVEVGVPGSLAQYKSGSQTPVIALEYLTRVGDNTERLQYIGRHAMSGIITDPAGNRANITLSEDGSPGTFSTNHFFKIDTVDAECVNVTTTAADGIYGVLDLIPIVLTMSETVFVSGSPFLTLNTTAGRGIVNGRADYVGGSGSLALTFLYNVTFGGESTHLDYVDFNPLTLNGGSVIDVASNPLDLSSLPFARTSRSLSNSSALRIETLAPLITNMDATTFDGGYTVGATIRITVQFDMEVTVIGLPEFVLRTGPPFDRVAVFDAATPRSSDLITFTYVVQTSDNTPDLDLANPADAWQFNPTAIIYRLSSYPTLRIVPPSSFAAVGAVGSLSRNRDLLIDTTSPVVVAVSGSPASGSFREGKDVNVLVTFSEPVYMYHTSVRMQLNAGGGYFPWINYVGGNTTAVFTFLYTVADGENTLDLDYASTASLAKTASAGSLQDFITNEVDLTLPVIGHVNSLASRANIIVDTRTPLVDYVRSTTANGAYAVATNVRIEVVMDEPIYMAGTATLDLVVNSDGTVLTLNSLFASGSSVVFDLTVAAGMNIPTLAYNSTSAFVLGSGATLQDAAGNDADLQLPALGSANSLSQQSAIELDTTVPTVVNVTSSTPNGAYREGSELYIEVLFSEPILLSGATPVLTVNVPNYATTFTGASTRTLSFHYVVQPDHFSTDLDVAAITVGGTIRDIADNDADLTVPTTAALAYNSDIEIDAVRPRALVAASPDGAAANKVYGTGALVRLFVQFSDPVTVIGTPPKLLLELGAVDRYALYTAGSGDSSGRLTFELTVGGSDTAARLDYASSTALVVEGELRKTAHPELNLTAITTLPAPGTPGSIGSFHLMVVDTQAGTIQSITVSTAVDKYGVGVAIELRVDFDETIVVTSTAEYPRIKLNTLPTPAYATYQFGSNTQTLRFRFTTTVGHNANPLDYFDVNSFELGGVSTVTDLGGIDVVLTLPTKGSAGSDVAPRGVEVDTTPPVVRFANVTSAKAANVWGHYLVEADAFTPTVQFSEPVWVTPSNKVYLSMAITPTNPVLQYASGSGTDVLTFDEHTVVDGEHTNHALLDYASAAALTLSAPSNVEDDANPPNQAILTLPEPGEVGSLSYHEMIVDTIEPYVLDVTSIVDDGTYTDGSSIPITVTFSEETIVGSINLLELSINSSSVTLRPVDYGYAHNATYTFAFNPTVVTASIERLQYKSEASLVGPSSVVGVADFAQNLAVYTLPTPGEPGSLSHNKHIRLDTVKPTVVEVLSPLSEGTYMEGDRIPIYMIADEPLRVVGHPILRLEIESREGGPVPATYVGMHDANTVEFLYIVQDEHYTDGILNYHILGLDMSNATITDVGTPGNPMVTNLPLVSFVNETLVQSGLIIDGVTPIVVNVTSSFEGLAKRGTVIELLVEWSEPVRFSALHRSVAPHVLLNAEPHTGGYAAEYISGDSTALWTFEYTVPNGHEVERLALLDAQPFRINATDIAGNPVNSTVDFGKRIKFDHQDVRVDGVLPRVTEVRSETPDGPYAEGDHILIDLYFSEPLLDIETDLPFLSINVLEPIEAFVQMSEYSAALNRMRFDYTVSSGENANPLIVRGFGSTNFGSMLDLHGNPMNETLPSETDPAGLAGNATIVVDTTPPAITEVTTDAPDAIYTTGAQINIYVEFTEFVTVTNAALDLDVGTGVVSLTRASFSGTSMLMVYTVEEGHNTAALKYDTVSALSADTFVDVAGGAGNTFLTVPGFEGSLSFAHTLVIDGVLPKVVEVTAANAATGYAYVVGDVVEVSVEFSRDIRLEGAGVPTLLLDLLPAPRNATYARLEQSRFMIFTLVVEENELSAGSFVDYVSTASLVNNGRVIRDNTTGTPGNIADLTLAAPGAAGSLSDSRVRVDAVPPTVETVDSLPAVAIVAFNETITVRVMWSEAVQWDVMPNTNGTFAGGAVPSAAELVPQLTVLLDEGVTYDVAYTSGNGTDEWLFEYTVQDGHEARALGYASEVALHFNATFLYVRDAASNDVQNITLPWPCTHGSLRHNARVRVDGVRPRVTNVTTSLADGVYGVAQNVEIVLHFSEPVTYVRAVNVSSTPNITLHLPDEFVVSSDVALADGWAPEFRCPTSFNFSRCESDLIEEVCHGLGCVTVLNMTAYQCTDTGAPAGYCDVYDMQPHANCSSCNMTSRWENVTIADCVTHHQRDVCVDFIVNGTLQSNCTVVNYTIPCTKLVEVFDMHTCLCARNETCAGDCAKCCKCDAATFDWSRCGVYCADAQCAACCPMLSCDTGTFDYGQCCDASCDSWECRSCCQADLRGNWTQAAETTSALTFNYEVEKNHETDDLDVMSLVMSAVDANGNALLTDVPSGETTDGALGKNADVVVDGVPPGFVFFKGPSDTYTVGQEVRFINVTFDEPVFLSNTSAVRLVLDTGAATESDKWATLVEGDGSRKLTFLYIVKADDDTSFVGLNTETPTCFARAVVRDVVGNELEEACPISNTDKALDFFSNGSIVLE